MNTAPVVSSISFIDGEKGILRYRGYPIEQLAEKSSFVEVAYLLMYGELPAQEEFDRWNEAVMRHTALPASVRATIDALPHDAHPMGTILTGMCALSTFHPEQNPAMSGQSIYQNRNVQDKQIVRILGKVRSPMNLEEFTRGIRCSLCSGTITGSSGIPSCFG